MTSFDIIKRRVSVRDYAGRTLTGEQRDRLDEVCAAAEAPFGGRIKIMLVSFSDGGALRPGTYGVIRGARDFLILATDGSDAAMLSAGYAFEQVVLEATRMGLGTCWIAATFRGSAFAKAANLAAGMEIAAVSPVGVPSGRRHLIERITRTFARETSRIDFEKLFFLGNLTTPLTRDSRFACALEAVRAAPSSVNSQPWRVLVAPDGRCVHFYSCRRNRYMLLDMGIALCHFHVVCAETGIDGAFKQMHDAPDISGLSYLRSFIVK